MNSPPMGAGPDEMARYRAVLRSATIKENMTRAGVPGVEQVWCHEVGAARAFSSFIELAVILAWLVVSFVLAVRLFRWR